jgi:DNA-binding NarL/FixJ family response regulator
VTACLALYLLEEERLNPPAEHSLAPWAMEILCLVAEGTLDREISARLFIAVIAVQSNVDRVRDETGSRCRPTLTPGAMGRGIPARSTSRVAASWA